MDWNKNGIDKEIERDRDRDEKKTAKAIFTCQTVISLLGMNSFYSSELKQNNATPNQKQMNIQGKQTHMTKYLIYSNHV